MPRPRPPLRPHQPVPAAAPADPAGPKAIGTFEDWTAATNTAAGQTDCYAFARAGHSAPALAGRGAVVLTVTQRSIRRDAVAIRAGFAYRANAAVTVQVDQNALDFYTSGAAPSRATAMPRSPPSSSGKQVTRALARAAQRRPWSDTFSLKGFGKAYEAINKACPAK